MGYAWLWSNWRMELLWWIKNVSVVCLFTPIVLKDVYFWFLTFNFIIKLLAAPTDTATPVEQLMQVDYKYSGMSYRSSPPSYVDRVLIPTNENEQFL